MGKQSKPKRGQKGWMPVLFSVLVMLVLFPACTKEKLEEISSGLEEGLGQLPGAPLDPIKEVLPETGKIELQSSPPITVDKAIAAVYAVGDGRPNSVQITSYDPGGTSTGSPSIFLHGNLDSGTSTVALVANKPVPCMMYVEQTSGGEVFRTPVGSPVKVIFGAMNMQEKTIEATLGPCALRGSDGNSIRIPGGKILAIVNGN